MKNFQKNGVLNRLTELDNDLVSLYGMSRRFEMTITGGSAFIVLDILPNERFTSDIDVLKTILDDITEVRANLEDEEWTAIQNRLERLLSGEIE